MNKVELVGIYGGDETIALSAWTSTSRDLSESKKQRIGKMVETLWMDQHKSPYEKAIVHFLVTVDQASHIHTLKHRIASINGESARYKELKQDKFYIPEDWSGNPILYKWAEKLREQTHITNKLYHDCLKETEPILGRKRAKESSRFFKMFNSQIQLDVLFNMSSFANFYELRYSEHAQLEIREIADKMMKLIEDTGKLNSSIKAIKTKKEINDNLQKLLKIKGPEFVNDLLISNRKHYGHKENNK